VEIWLCTHDDNNQITAKDHELANMINEIKWNYFTRSKVK
jgi:hypothetical protein